MSALQNVLLLMDTLACLESIQFDTLHGGEFDVYIKNHRGCHVLLPEDVEKLKQTSVAETKVPGKCKVTCEDTDTYTKACQLYKELKPWETEGPVCFFHWNQKKQRSIIPITENIR